MNRVINEKNFEKKSEFSGVNVYHKLPMYQIQNNYSFSSNDIFYRYISSKYKSIPSVIGPKMGDFLKPLALSLSLCVLAFGLYTHMFVFFKFSAQQFAWVILFPLVCSGCALAFRSVRLKLLTI